MKKLISMALCLVMLLSSAAGTVGAHMFINDESYTLGDADGDGEQNGKDALSIKATVAGLEGYSLIEDAADFNGDGVVDAKDSYLMKTCLAGTNSFEVLEGEYQIYNLTIGKNPIKDYAISVPEGTDIANDNVYYAATEMQKYIEIATGVHLEIYIGKAPSKKVIRYHTYEVDTPENLEMGLRLENYKYTVKDGDLDIHGSLRGNMYATYEIIEDHLGFRFYNGHYTYVYKNRTVDIPEGCDRFFAPKMDFRQVYHTNGSGTAFEYYFPRRNNGVYIYSYAESKYGTLTGALHAHSHSFIYLWMMGTGTMPDESYGTLGDRLYYKYNSGETHDPLGWQPCGTNDKQYNIMFSGLVDTCRMMEEWGKVYYCFEEYGIASMYVSIEDNGNYCACRTCTKKAKTEGYSGVYLDVANRAAVDIQEYYQGLKIAALLYDHKVPQNVRPDKNIIISFAGPACNNHPLGMGGCGDDTTYLGGSNDACCTPTAKAWGDICRETGAEIWNYYYPVTYGFYLTPCPNIFNIYYDFDYMINVCGFNGIFYEGAGETYMFENLKAYMAQRMLWEPEMGLERFIEIMKEYLYMYYGDGYEYIYEYIVMTEEAGDLVGCFVNNHDRPWDYYSHDYIAENYEYMRGLLTSALELAERSDSKIAVKNLIAGCDLLGLSALHVSWYLEGDEESRALYEERYTDLYNYVKERKMTISGHTIYSLPETVIFDIDPIVQFYERSAWNDKNVPTYVHK